MSVANSPVSKLNEPDANLVSEPRPANFIRDIVIEDLNTKKFGGAAIQTRFPPEPNGYLHIGHAKSICLNFGLADEFGGKTNLRFDDTNPEKEEQEYVDSIQADVRWLGFDWERLCYASDYFPQLFAWAVKLIEAGKAYVDELTADEIRQYRGTLTRWYLANLRISPPQKSQSDRLNITYTLLSKRKLLQLVQENHVKGWDDPRMPTLSGFRRRGFTPEAIRTFVNATGVSRSNGIIDIEMLEHFQRDDLNRRASRPMAVLHPLKLVTYNYPQRPNQGQTEFVEVPNNPQAPPPGPPQRP